jgi:hypothetical protein
MNPNPAWLLLRVPRTESATTMSGVLGVEETCLATAEGANIPVVCDALLEKAKAAGHELGRIIMVYPLDGRHGVAHAALAESQRRGWGFARHVPHGAEPHLLDLMGPDAGPGLSSSELAARFDAHIKEIQSAVEHSELAEALAVLRQMLAMGLLHFGAWHPDTFWAASNLMRFSAGTGAAPNIDQAAGLIDHLLRQPLPAKFENPFGLFRKLEETAKNCAQSGRGELATRVLESAVLVARQEFGEGTPNHLATQNNLCLMLSSLKSPKAEPAMRELLRTARAAMGERHPNVAVVLLNLAELLENLGRADEAAPLRAEAQSIRGAAT